jgi:4-hydroxy-3-methylbut-2-enyl diphosphate reductase
VPDELVMEVIDHLAERGFDEVAEFTTTQETLTFSLPQTLKRDMRAAEQQRAAAVAAALTESE